MAVALPIAALSLLLVARPAPVGAQAPAPNATTASYEITFLKEMVHHHHMAVMMSMVCVDRGGELRPELVELCQDIIETQDREITMMLTWLSDWYGIRGYNPHEEMTPEMIRMLEMMRSMPARELERFFLEDMIVHHAAALQPARQCKGRAYHDELASLCRDIIKVQVAEIELMRQWLCHWFGECNFHIDPQRRREMHG